jgi:hypothetical protein
MNSFRPLYESQLIARSSVAKFHTASEPWRKLDDSTPTLGQVLKAFNANDENRKEYSIGRSTKSSGIVEPEGFALKSSEVKTLIPRMSARMNAAEPTRNEAPVRQ